MKKRVVGIFKLAVRLPRLVISYWCIFLIFQDILKDINARVAEKERKQRLFEIYNKIDPKANLVQLGTGRKFKKSDILLADRKLMFEGKATLQQARNRTQEVNVIVLSDILFFLHENNQKFYFCSPDILGIFKFSEKLFQK